MEAQRARILHAALRCISELGIEHTSITEIRKEAGLSAGALYRHFASKEDIVVEALRAASVNESYLPDSWPDFIAAIASMAEEHELGTAAIARSQLQVYAMAIRPGPLRALLQPLIADALDLVVAHLAQMEQAGRVRLRMTPLRTALAIGAIKDGIVWSGLALDRSFAEIEADIIAAVSCLAAPMDREDRPGSS
jgi:AcrR family transcriptional regulator